MGLSSLELLYILQIFSLRYHRTVFKKFSSRLSISLNHEILYSVPLYKIVKTQELLLLKQQRLGLEPHLEITGPSLMIACSVKALAGEREGSLGADHSMVTIRPGNTVLHLNSHLHLWGISED